MKSKLLWKIRADFWWFTWTNALLATRHVAHYAQNQRYTTYCIVVVGGHVHYRKFHQVWTCFWDLRADRQTDAFIAILCTHTGSQKTKYVKLSRLLLAYTVRPKTNSSWWQSRCVSFLRLRSFSDPTNGLSAERSERLKLGTHLRYRTHLRYTFTARYPCSRSLFTRHEHLKIDMYYHPFSIQDLK